mmetsp:Transcript_5635/g.16305  ORF Transcript_5635/g.16305 Transcript_5635/m.16305 type:complete len:450 (-) Transcript_5635:322-1671(-)
MIRPAAVSAAWASVRAYLIFISSYPVLLFILQHYFGWSSLTLSNTFATTCLLIACFSTYSHQFNEGRKRACQDHAGGHESSSMKTNHGPSNELMQTTTRVPRPNILTNTALPPDALVHICSYLHPLDVTTLACVDRSSRKLIDGKTKQKNGFISSHECAHETSNILWKSLWQRDYERVITEWDVGREALARSIRVSRINDVSTANFLLKESLDALFQSASGAARSFYFAFSETYMNFLLAGQNKPQRCLLGLHGHIFDFTSFADYHPGLSYPIMMECGRDGTNFFEDIPHSIGARRIAQRLCVVVNRACAGHTDAVGGEGMAVSVESTKQECGLFRLSATPLSCWSAKSSNTRPPSSIGHNCEDTLLRSILPQTVTKPRRPLMLASIRAQIGKEERIARRRAQRLHNASATTKNGARSTKVYYDPFRQQWRGWYSCPDLQPVFFDFNYS